MDRPPNKPEAGSRAAAVLWRIQCQGDDGVLLDNLCLGMFMTKSTMVFIIDGLAELGLVEPTGVEGFYRAINTEAPTHATNPLC